MTRSTDGLEVVADGLTYPTSILVDADHQLHVAESGLPFGGAEAGGRIWRINLNGSRALLASGLQQPVNGLAELDGRMYVSEGGHPARISCLMPDGALETVVGGFPGPGNYHLNMVAPGPDGRLYFSLGAMTNSGIIGLDGAELAWLRRVRHAADIPGLAVTLSGENVSTAGLTDGGGQVETGAFSPFGTPTAPGQRIAAALPATASVMRCDPDGTNLELVAWGLRNAYGLGFLPDGRLLALDQGPDERGSRPIGNAPDLLFEVKRGAWYGWPDFVGGVPVTDPRFRSGTATQTPLLLTNHDELGAPQAPLATFPPHSAATKFSVATSGRFNGQIFVCLFGDEAPMTTRSRERSGRCVVRLDLEDGLTTTVLTEPLLRPIDVHFDAASEQLYVLDFGEFEMTAHGVEAQPGTGVLWRLDLATP